MSSNDLTTADRAELQAQQGYEEWQPAVIASHEHVAKLHDPEPGIVSRFAGERVRVRRNEECERQMGHLQRLYLGCPGHTIELHPDDGWRLFPEDMERAGGVALCTCAVLMD